MEGRHKSWQGVQRNLGPECVARRKMLENFTHVRTSSVLNCHRNSAVLKSTAPLQCSTLCAQNRFELTRLASKTYFRKSISRSLGLCVVFARSSRRIRTCRKSCNECGCRLPHKHIKVATLSIDSAECHNSPLAKS